MTDPLSLTDETSLSDAYAKPDGEAKTKPSNIEINLSNIWVLFYLRNGSTATQMKFFHSPGELHEVVERSKIYCTKMNFRWIRNEKFLTKFADEEARRDAYESV